jgi:hypothetical protein
MLGQKALIGQSDSFMKSQDLTLGLPFFQIADEFNYGLVHNGAAINVEYRFGRVKRDQQLELSSKLSIGLNGNHGLGADLRVTPLDIFFGKTWSTSRDIDITLGAYTSFNYSWQLYPQLQSGHMFWMTNYELGPRLRIEGMLLGELFQVGISNSVIGLISRPQPSVETYFYSLKSSDFIRNAHEDMTLVAQDKLTDFEFHIEYKPQCERLSAIGYKFRYLEYQGAPEFARLEHGLYARMILGKKHKN